VTGRPSRLPPRPSARPRREPWWSPVEHRPDPAADDAGAAAGTAGEDTVALPLAPLTRHGRPARAPRPPRLPPGRAVAGALVAVAGVALGIGTLLWATEAPPSAGPAAVTAAGAESAPAEPDALDEPAVEDPPAAEGAADPVSPAVAPPAPAPPPPAPAPVEARPAADEPPLLVLNNSRIPGLAERAARRFEAGGWPVRDTGSLRGRIRATTVYYPSGQRAAAEELARRFPEVRRVLPRLAGLPGTGLTVVVTRDLA
jgi:hypothetical protein